MLGCAEHSSAALAPGRCLRHVVDHPRSQQPQIQEWQQKHHHLLGCAGRSSTDLDRAAVTAPACTTVTTAPDSRMAAKAHVVAWMHLADVSAMEWIRPQPHPTGHAKRTPVRWQPACLIVHLHPPSPNLATRAHRKDLHGATMPAGQLNIHLHGAGSRFRVHSSCQTRT